MLANNWRYLIAENGMTHLGWQLCARFAGPASLDVYVVKESATQWGVWIQLPALGPILTRLLGPFPLSEGDRFPYGIDVLRN